MQQFFNSSPLSVTRTQTPTTFPVTGAKKVAPNKKKAPQKKVIASVGYCSTDLYPFSRILSIDSPGPNNVYFNAAGIVFHTNIPRSSLSLLDQIMSILNLRVLRLLGLGLSMKCIQVKMMIWILLTKI